MPGLSQPDATNKVPSRLPCQGFDLSVHVGLAHPERLGDLRHPKGVVAEMGLDYRIQLPDEGVFHLDGRVFGRRQRIGITVPGLELPAQFEQILHLNEEFFPVKRLGQVGIITSLSIRSGTCSRATSRAAIHGDGAVMELDQFPGEGQADACAFLCTRTGHIDLVKAIENVRQVFRGTWI